VNEPLRLRDSNGAARALLGAGKLEVPRGARQRALAFTSVAASVATTGTAAAAGATSLFKSVVVCVCLGTVGGGLASLAVSETLSRLQTTAADVKPAATRERPPSRSGATATPQPPPEAPVTPVPPSAPAPDAPVSSAVTVGPATTAAAAPTNSNKPQRASSLFDEQRIIESARAAASRGDTASALATLESYQQIYGQGQFGPEALALRIEALSAKGELGRARSLAAEFQRRYPHHPLLASVQAAAGAKR